MIIFIFYLNCVYFLFLLCIFVYICNYYYPSKFLNLLQKFVHLRNVERDVQVHYTREVMWWLGMLLMAVGELFNFMAYGFAPASVVAPLGTTTVVGQFISFNFCTLT